MNINPKKQDKDIERAVVMIVSCIQKNCRNKKPLILHSLRVGIKLLEIGQPTEIVLAGFLHDLVEDTACTLEQIRKEFGDKVAGLVYALTQEKIADYKKRWHILLGKIKKAGKGAMIIKVIDATDNMAFVPLIREAQGLRELLWKYEFTIQSLEPYIDDLEVFKEFKAQRKIIIDEIRKREAAE